MLLIITVEHVRTYVCMHTFRSTNSTKIRRKRRNGGGRACSAASTMNEYETCIWYINLFPVQCARYYAIPGTIGNPKEPTRLLSIRVSHEVRREVSQCQVALADPNRFQMMIINDTRSAGNAVHYRISDTVIIPIIRAGDKHEFHHRISFVPSDGWLITLSPTV